MEEQKKRNPLETEKEGHRRHKPVHDLVRIRRCVALWLIFLHNPRGKVCRSTGQNRE